ncbi:unnamed protein product, partial [Coffea canephora]
EGGRKPWNSINFVCAHDGFTLADLVTYNNKHNTANGEDNKDGENHNNSWNCGQVNVYFHIFIFVKRLLRFAISSDKQLVCLYSHSNRYMLPTMATQIH